MIGRLALDARPADGDSTVRLKRLTRRLMLPAAIAATVLFIAVGSYAYFSTTGSGTGLAISGFGPLAAPELDPLGAPAFDLTNMVPGDTSTQSVTVTAVGGGTAPTQISIYEPTATGTQLSELSLEIVEDGSTVVYNGPFATGWTAAAPLVIPGSDSGLWDAGEQHHLVFTVTFALTADNTFQSTSASASFVWTRTQG